MRRRYRQHVNPLKATSLAPREPLDVPAGPDLEVELGCGDGMFLLRRADAAAGRLFVGLDIRPEFIEPGLDEIAHQGRSNVRLETANFLVDLPHLFPPQRVAVFWINFPDPWFKRRHRNRRWLTATTLDCLVDALRADGEICFQSDVWSITIDAMALLEGHPKLSNTAGEFSFLRQPLVEEQTSREIACLEEGRRIWRMRFLRG